MRRIVLTMTAVLALMTVAACERTKICEPGVVVHEKAGTSFVCAADGRKWARLNDIEVTR